MENRVVEDFFDDVLSKAARGIGISLRDVSAKLGLSDSSLVSLLRGSPDYDAHLVRMAEILELNFDALLRLRANPVGPSVELPSCIHRFSTPFPVRGYEEMRVNSYLFCPRGLGPFAVAFDTGSIAGADSLAKVLTEHSRRLAKLFLTHTHLDHVGGLDRFIQLGATPYAPQLEPWDGCKAVADGDVFEFGVYRMRALLTSGHSVGGTSYLVEGLGIPVAFVGDAIFCLSMGKADGKIADAKSSIRKHLLSLPETTILCPGHGPVTTVGHELRNNPFFA